MTSDDLADARGEPGRLRAEVARLTAELTASRQRETALQDRLTGTTSILRAIADGPHDAQAVLQVIVETAARLCQAVNVSMFRVVDGAAEYKRVANLDGDLHRPPVGQRTALAPGSWVGRSILERPKQLPNS